MSIDIVRKFSDSIEESIKQTQKNDRKIVRIDLNTLKKSDDGNMLSSNEQKQKIQNARNEILNLRHFLDISNNKNLHECIQMKRICINVDKIVKEFFLFETLIKTKAFQSKKEREKKNRQIALIDEQNFVDLFSIEDSKTVYIASIRFKFQRFIMRNEKLIAINDLQELMKAGTTEKDVKKNDYFHEANEKFRQHFKHETSIFTIEFAFIRIYRVEFRFFNFFRLIYYDDFCKRFQRNLFEGGCIFASFEVERGREGGGKEEEKGEGKKKNENEESESEEKKKVENEKKNNLFSVKKILMKFIKITLSKRQIGSITFRQIFFK